MAIQRFDNGPRMSRVVVHGDTVYLAGLTAEKTAGQSVGEQTKEILDRIDGLSHAGRHRQVEARSGRDLAAGRPRRRRVQQGVGRLGGAGPGPARACIEARLQSPAKMIEIQVTAAR